MCSIYHTNPDVSKINLLLKRKEFKTHNIVCSHLCEREKKKKDETICRLIDTQKISG